MLFTEAQLKSANNPMAVLDEAVYLDESETLIDPTMVPVREMSRLGKGVTMVRFDDIAALAESHGTDYIDAMIAVAEASSVDPELMAVAVDEADIITDPDIVNELANVVVTPINENDMIYTLCEETLALYENGLIDDDDFDSIIINEADFNDNKQIFDKVNAMYQKHINRDEKRNRHKSNMNARAEIDERRENARDRLNKYLAKKNDFSQGYDPMRHKSTYEKKPEPQKQGPEVHRENTKDGYNEYSKNPDGTWTKTMHRFFQKKGETKLTTAGKVAAGALGAGLAAGAIYGINKYRNQPKSIIGKKIASLRSLYKKYMNSANSNPAKAGIFKKIAGKILSAIDKLLGYMQNAAG